MTKTVRSLVAMGALVGGCDGSPVDSPPEPRDPAAPATVLELYFEAINTRSLPDYLALHVDGFVIERLDEGRYCLPWLDDDWWSGGSPPPECGDAALGEVFFDIINERTTPDQTIEVMTNVNVILLVGSDSGWLSDGRIVLDLVEMDGALLIARIVEQQLL